MIQKETKLKIIAAIKAHEENYVSRIRHAAALGIAPSQLTQILKGKLDRVISDANWISIARKYDVALKDEVKLHTARTATFNHIWAQLEFAQENSVSGILCDRADIGKTHTALIYAREHKNVAYIDCGRNKNKTQFIRAIAKEFGLNHKNYYGEVFDELVFFLKTTDDRPLIILDEFGDLNYPTYLEFKAIWNATDKHCGWYAMGADGLASKINREINKKKVGFAEIFSRLGNKYQRITPQTEDDFRKFQAKQIAQIGQANGCTEVQQLIAKTDMSLRRIPIKLGIDKKKKETETEA